MDKKTRYILHWIGQLSKIRPELGNFAICPYASNANFKILDEKLCKIVHQYYLQQCKLQRQNQN